MLVECSNCRMMIDSKLQNCLNCDHPVELTKGQRLARHQEKHEALKGAWQDVGRKRVVAGLAFISIGILGSVFIFAVSGGRAVSGVITFVGAGIAIVIAGLIKARTGID